MKELLINIYNDELLNEQFVLATDIYAYKSTLLLYKKGTRLTKDIIEKLKKFGIISIYVGVPSEIKIVKTNEQIVCRKLEQDLNEIYEYANEIIQTALNRKDIRKILTKIDENVYDHSHKVALLSTMLGLNIENLKTNDLEELALASILHDIGKSTIDFSILNKPGKLTDVEYEIVKQHSRNGYDILNRTGLFSETVCEAVLSHHENEDGTGYPNRQRGSEIPLYARIIHISDVYAALTAKRCYKDAWTVEKAIELLDKDKKNFEQDLLGIFKTALPIYMKGDIVLLSTNELGKVVESYNKELVVKVFGEQETVRINQANNKNTVHIKRKILLEGA